MQALSERIRAGYPGIALITHEEARAQHLLETLCKDIGHHLYYWTSTSTYVYGRNLPEGTPNSLMGQDLMQVLDAVSQIPDQSVLLLMDTHLYLSEPNPVLYRKFKDVMLAAKTRLVTLVLLMPESRIPLDLEKWFSIVEFQLPSRSDLEERVHLLCHEMNDADPPQMVRVRDIPSPEAMPPILNALAGLTLAEAEDALALSLVATGGFTPSLLLREKAATIKRNGLVEYLEPKLTLADVGGWDDYKAELDLARHQFSPEARAYHLEPLKGDLLLGQGGTGKSLTARLISTVFGVPCLRVRGDSLKGSLVGQTEANWRSVMATAKAISGNGEGGIVLWIDEMDGLTSGHKSSGHTDGGTTANLIKGMLQDIEDSTGIYFAFTGNDIENIPDPLIDRLNVWSVDLPNEAERMEIWAIHIRRRHRDPSTFDLKALAVASDGFSGRQIERVWLKALSRAFNDSRREPVTQDALDALKKETPTSKTMAAEIEARRTRLAGKARPVTTPKLTQPIGHSGGRKIHKAN